MESPFLVWTWGFLFKESSAAVRCTKNLLLPACLPHFPSYFFRCLLCFLLRTLPYPTPHPSGLIAGVTHI